MVICLNIWQSVVVVSLELHFGECFSDSVSGMTKYVYTRYYYIAPVHQKFAWIVIFLQNKIETDERLIDENIWVQLYFNVLAHLHVIMLLLKCRIIYTQNKHAFLLIISAALPFSTRNVPKRSSLIIIKPNLILWKKVLFVVVVLPGFFRYNALDT